MNKEDIYEKYNKKWQNEPIGQKECMMQMLEEWGEIYHKEQVKNCSIPYVVGQSEQLKCDHEPKRYDKKHTVCSECGKILQMKP